MVVFMDASGFTALTESLARQAHGAPWTVLGKPQVPVKGSYKGAIDVEDVERAFFTGTGKHLQPSIQIVW